MYLDSGYLDMAKIINTDATFVFVVGARGIGKTYGALKYLIERGNKFMLMRRTQLQCDLISKPDLSPLKSPLNDMGLDFKAVPISRQNSAYYLVRGDETSSTPFCYTAALSTFSNLRGFDASDVDYLVYDEFIPQKQERPIKEEAEAFYNCYETMNRNRELSGRKPIKAILLANSFDMANPLFISLGLVMRAEKMVKTGQSKYIDKTRGLALYIPQKSPVSDKKRKTALYKLTDKSGDYSRMALDNVFVNDTPDNVITKRLIEYVPVVKIGEIVIYKHKSNTTYYVSRHLTGTPKNSYTMSDNDRKRFVRQYGYLWQKFMNNQVYFENYLCQVLFDKALAL